MAIAFHIDRFNCLKENQTIDLDVHLYSDMINSSVVFQKLYSNGLSEFGMSFFDDSKTNIENFSVLTNKSTEIIAEYVRITSFPNCQSRMQSFFASPDVESLKKWIKTLNASNCSIFEIYYDDEQILPFDANYLRSGIYADDKYNFYFNVCEAITSAECYFQRKMSSNPLLELLLPLPITIGKRIYFIK